jgi:hypothetical protein
MVWELEAQSSIPDEGKLSFFCTASKKALRPTDLRIQSVLASPSPEVKLPGREAYLPTASSDKIKPGGATPPLSDMSSWHN